MMAPMNLVEILLPVRDNAGATFPKSSFDLVKNELTDRFGGQTAFTRSPPTVSGRTNPAPLTPKM
jgi:hypothetical protein